MICANQTCRKEFEPKTHNQKYCVSECCRVETNRRIMEKYYENKAIKNGAERPCKKCGAQLSRYNKNSLCSSCHRATDLNIKNKILGMINDIS